MKTTETECPRCGAKIRPIKPFSLKLFVFTGGLYIFYWLMKAPKCPVCEYEFK